MQLVLTPGTKILLGLLAATYLTSVIGKTTHSFDLYDWLALSGSKFMSGQVWRLVTYALLPCGVLDFAMNCIALVMLGGLLERHWPRAELWLYCVATTAGGGLSKVILQYSSPTPMTGVAPMLFGLLIAWGVLCGRETINLLVVGEITVWKLVLGTAATGLLMMFLSAGLAMMLVLASGGFTGWFYLWLKQKWLLGRPSRVAHSERINRLEL